MSEISLTISPLAIVIIIFAIVFLFSIINATSRIFLRGGARRTFRMFMIIISLPLLLYIIWQYISINEGMPAPSSVIDVFKEVVEPSKVEVDGNNIYIEYPEGVNPDEAVNVKIGKGNASIDMPDYIPNTTGTFDTGLLDTDDLLRDDWIS